MSMWYLLGKLFEQLPELLLIGVGCFAIIYVGMYIALKIIYSKSMMKFFQDFF